MMGAIAVLLVAKNCCTSQGTNFGDHTYSSPPLAFRGIHTYISLIHYTAIVTADGYETSPLH